MENAYSHSHGLVHAESDSLVSFNNQHKAEIWELLLLLEMAPQIDIQELAYKLKGPFWVTSVHATFLSSFFYFPFSSSILFNQTNSNYV